MKLVMLLLQAGDIKNVIKREGHSACFHATMLTDTVIKVIFGDLRAQQSARLRETQRSFKRKGAFISLSIV